MRYQELLPVRNRLNYKFTGKPLPHTDMIVRDFVIVPSKQSKPDYEKVAHAIRVGVPLPEVENTIKDNENLSIRIRLRDIDYPGLYSPEELGCTLEFLDEFNYA